MPVVSTFFASNSLKEVCSVSQGWLLVFAALAVFVTLVVVIPLPQPGFPGRPVPRTGLHTLVLMVEFFVAVAFFAGDLRIGDTGLEPVTSCVSSNPIAPSLFSLVVQDGFRDLQDYPCFLMVRQGFGAVALKLRLIANTIHRIYDFPYFNAFGGRDHRCNLQRQMSPFLPCYSSPCPVARQVRRAANSKKPVAGSHSLPLISLPGFFPEMARNSDTSTGW
jgi:hypothetical protein